VTCPLPRMSRPCGGPQPCPWRRDAPPGQFPPERWQALRATSRRPDGHGSADAPLGFPMFACHATHEGADRVCAGWLAVEGWGHLGIRLAVLTGALPESALAPGVDWPPLHGSYEELAAVNGAPHALTDSPQRVNLGGMTEMTMTREAPRERTGTYLAVEMALKARHPDEPDLTLESWVRAQRRLGVAWRPMAPKLWEAAGLNDQPKRLRVGYEALRRWFEYIDAEENLSPGAD
jgi:hypothetical protein